MAGILVEGVLLIALLAISGALFFYVLRRYTPLGRRLQQSRNRRRIEREAAPLQDWYARAAAADWATPAHIKAQFADASILKEGRVVFNIGGHKYRLVVRINYPYRVVYIRFVGTHAEYGAIDAAMI